MEEIAFDLTKKYPPVEPPDGAKGELRNVAANKCLDTRFKVKIRFFEVRIFVFIVSWRKYLGPKRTFRNRTVRERSPRSEWRTAVYFHVAQGHSVFVVFK